jgi:heterodisulfide reductase subunit A-like polyferredoxin
MTVARVGVVICTCGTLINPALDMKALLPETFIQ